MTTRRRLNEDRPRTLGCVVFVLALGLALLPGCANRRQELVESELRQKERELEELKSKVDHRDGEVRALEMELELLLRKAAKEAKDTPSAAGESVILKRIRLGRMTGGLRQDVRVGADDALQVLIEPIDTDDHVVKVPGSARIDVFEIATNGTKTFLSQWDVSAREMRRAWDSPLIGGAAYRLTFPWKVQPTTERIRIVVKFTTLAGELFEDEKDVSITLPAVRGRTQREAPSAPMMETIIEEHNVPPSLPYDLPISKKGAPTKAAPRGPLPDMKAPLTQRSAPPPMRSPHQPAAAVPPAHSFIPPMVPIDPPLSFQMNPWPQGAGTVQQTQYEEPSSPAGAGKTPVVKLAPPVRQSPKD